MIIKRHKWGWIGHTLRKDESSVWMVLGEEREDPARRVRTVERECKKKKTWPDLKQLAQSRVRWRVVVVDALCPGWDQGY